MNQFSLKPNHGKKMEELDKFISSLTEFHLQTKRDFSYEKTLDMMKKMFTIISEIDVENNGQKAKP